MSNDFGPLDSLSAELWLRLTIQAWPLRIVSREEFARMTAHLRHGDDEQPERRV
jgi:hypothetical protein